MQFNQGSTPFCVFCGRILFKWVTLRLHKIRKNRVLLQTSRLLCLSLKRTLSFATLQIFFMLSYSNITLTKVEKVEKHNRTPVKNSASSAAQQQWCYVTCSHLKALPDVWHHHPLVAVLGQVRVVQGFLGYVSSMISAWQVFMRQCVFASSRSPD